MGGGGGELLLRTAKWGGARHWEQTGIGLGSDEWGDWVGFPTGTHHARPGAAFVSEVDSVTLLPRKRRFDHAYWAASFHAPGIWCDLYIDVAFPADFEAGGETCVTKLPPGAHASVPSGSFCH